ncbi:unnamed protein product [Anisakis simplex]|uniref:G_PROTEIN_RECEP_F1_2 domain-containing protein n=1 Tax=Anisakis simplex TaxID=6269 RepID=A0A0M3J543_ANISI|nr:unnamed protein product [Anisakis simplex]VDK20128.1 unnamed protein product [Anisakis simplex]
MNKRRELEMEHNVFVRGLKILFSSFYFYIAAIVNCISYTARKQYRTLRKRQVVRYECVPLSPLSARRLSMFI